MEKLCSSAFVDKVNSQLIAALPAKLDPPQVHLKGLLLMSKRNEIFAQYGIDFENCSTPDLKQRNIQDMENAASEQSKIRYSRNIFGPINATQSWVIIRQNEQIIRQNEQIINQNAGLAHQNQKIMEFLQDNSSD